MGENENSGWERPEIAGALPEGGPGRLLRQVAVAAGAFAAVLIAAVFIAVAAVPVSAAGTTGGSGFTVANVLSSVKMFYGCGVLEGQNGTKFNSGYDDAARALVDKEGQTGYLSTKTVIAIYSDADNSLTFYNGKVSSVKVGDVYNGKIVTAIYSGFDTETYASASSVPWYSYQGSITSVVVEDEIAPISTAYWFYGFTACKEIGGLYNLNTSNVTDMSYMFYRCSDLTSLDLSSFNTSNVTDMSHMFYRCSDLTSLDLSSFDTSSVTNMSSMFYNCSGLTSLDLSSFDTSSVTNMSSMFSDCCNLTTIYVTGLWSTELGIAFSNVFDNCSALVGGNGTVFDSAHIDSEYAVIDTDNTPGYLTAMAFAVLSSTSSASSPTKLSFYAGTRKMPRVGDKFDESYVKAVYTGIEFDTYTSTSDVPWYSYRSDITTVNVADTISPVSTARWFYGFTNLSSARLNLSRLDTTKIKAMSYMFYRCTKLTTLDLGSFTIGTGCDGDYMFAYCYSLETIYVTTSGHWRSGRFLSSHNMFYLCNSLVGGNGTSYADMGSNDDTYACIDSASVKGYLTEKTAFAIYSADDNSLTFYDRYMDTSTVVEGGRYNSKTITAVYTGFDKAEYKSSSNVPWNEYASDITTVFFADIIMPKSTAYWFYNFKSWNKITTIANVASITNLYTDNVTDMKYMFYNCNSLTSLNVSGFVTSNVTDMHYMFYNCSNVAKLNVSSWDTSNVTDMNYMFYNCSSLTSLGLSSFDVSGVTDMRYMFSGCSSLTSLDVSSFDTSGVTNMQYMFRNCSSLTSLDVSSFSTSGVTSMIYMFSGCSSLTSLDVSSFDTSGVTDTRYMFSGCSSLTSLDVSSFSTSGVTSMIYMFSGCSSLTSLDVSSFDTSEVTIMQYMFNGCSSLATIYASSKWTTANVTSSSNMFKNCASLVGGNGTVFDSGHIDAEYACIDSPSTAGYLTRGGFAVYSADKGSLVFYSDANDMPAVGDVFNGATVTAVYENITNLSSCSSYTQVPWYSYRKNITSVTAADEMTAPGSMAYWFYYCSALQAVNLDKLDTSNVTNMRCMFYYCSNLTTLDLSTWDTSNVTSMLWMFANCSSLTILDLSSWDTSNVTDMSWMFANCSSLTILDLSSWDTSNVTDMCYMFYYCPKLKTIYAGSEWSIKNTTTSNDMFTGCTSLVGGNGTAYDSGHINAVYARIDTDDTPGYLTAAAYAVYSADDGSLTFYSASRKAPVEGETYNGKTATAVFTGFIGTEYTSSNYMERPWYDYRENVKSVVFADKIAPEGVGYYFHEFANCTYMDIDKLDTSKSTSMNCMFYKCSSLAGVDVSGLDLSNVTQTQSMFAECTSLKTLNAGGWDTSKITTMFHMFYDCSSLTALNIDGWDTAKVTSMRYTFYYCSSLTSLDVSGWNTASVTDMQAMFSGCSALASLDVSGWDTSSAKYMQYMFFDCSAIEALDVSSWNTAKVTAMYDLFYGCSTLKTLDVSGWEVSNITNMQYMFYGCSALETLDLSSWNTENNTNLNSTFRNCSSLTTIYAGNCWNTDAVTGQTDTFKGCTSLVGGAGTTYDSSNIDATYARIDGGPDSDTPGYLTLGTAFAVYSADDNSLTFYRRAESNIPEAGDTFGSDGLEVTAVWTGIEETSSVGWHGYRTSIEKVEVVDGIAPTSLGSWFYGFTVCEEWTGLENIDTSGVTTLASTFSGCSSLDDISVLSGWDVSGVTTLASTFSGCSSLDDISALSGWDVSGVTTLASTFSGCSSLDDISALADWDTGSVTTLASTFYGCSSLDDISALADWDTGSVTTLASTFYGCSSLDDISALSGWDVSGVTTLASTFYGCNSLTSISALSGWGVSSVTTLQSTFRNCISLTSISALGGWDVSGVKTLSYTFSGCSGLTSITALTNWDVSKVTNMSYTFSGCSSLTSISALSGWDVSGVTALYCAFYGCSALQRVDLSGWDTSKVTDMRYMFYNCTGLRTIYVGSGWSTVKVTASGSSDYMFYNCTSLKGGAGTTYNSSYVDATYARIDGGPKSDTPGYLTNGQ